MKYLFIVINLLFFSNNSKNSTTNSIENFENSSTELTTSITQVIRTNLYKGTLNGSTPIRLYINEQEQPCGGFNTILNVMYKYDSQDKWILLNVSTDREKKNFCMVEDGFTGVLFLEAIDNKLSGHWVSPNTKKQFKVELQKVDLDAKTKEHLELILFDELIYGKNDC